MGGVRNERAALMIQMVVAFLAITTMAGTRPTATYRALGLGATTFEVGLVQSAYSILPAITAVLIGRWVDRYGEVLIYSASLGILGVGAVVSALAVAAGSLVFLPLSVSPPVLIVLIGIFGLGLGFGQPMAVTFVANRATKADRATAMGVRLTANRISLLFVPAIMGAAAGTAGVDAVFWILAGIIAAGSAVAVVAKLDATPAGDQPRSEEPGSAPSRP